MVQHERVRDIKKKCALHVVQAECTETSKRIVGMELTEEEVGKLDQCVIAYEAEVDIGEIQRNVAAGEQ